MKHNHDEEAYSIIQNSSKQNPSNRIGSNENVFQRNHLFNHDKAQCSASKEETFDRNSTKKYVCDSGELTPCNDQLIRNMGEHFLFKDLEYSQSIKSFCFTSNAEINCINEEDSKIISTGNNKHYIQKVLNNGRNVKLTIKEDFSNKINNNNIAHMLTSNVKLYEDKTTYCRPVLNYYNQQFLYKTMERNAKLKNLVKKLSIARQREKEKVNWNNFINELKNKHRYCHDDALLDEYVTPEIINDCDNTTFSSQKPRLCRNILQDFYGAYGTLQSHRLQAQHQRTPQNIQYLPCNNNPYCYPTSSMGRLIMLKRDQDKYKCKSLKEGKICNSGRNDDALAYKSYVTNSNGYNDMNSKDFKSSLVQVNDRAITPFIENIKKDKAISNREMQCSHQSNETNTVEKFNDLKLENTDNLSLVNIENKLECLIVAINKFMVQIKSREGFDRDIKYDTVPCKTEEKLIMVKKDSLDTKEKENKVIPKVEANKSGNTLATAYGSQSDEYSEVNDILTETNTNNQVDFQNQYENMTKKPFSAQILIEVPTKDCCTEVTKSLSKQKVENEEVTIEEIAAPKGPPTQKQLLPIQRMTIAVNTDPLSFLALLRFSTETLKRLMSYMPNFDYISYLSALSFLQTPRTADSSSYICKICGAAFDSPTKLSDHIHGHDLGKTRDCCVCRHVLERARNSLFSCQYCGQHFTRAYCCELHQQSCAKRLGMSHNAASSLMLLR